MTVQKLLAVLTGQFVCWDDMVTCRQPDAPAVHQLGLITGAVTSAAAPALPACSVCRVPHKDPLALEQEGRTRSGRCSTTRSTGDDGGVL